MRQIKVIITGTTGMVGEGVLMSCLSDSRIAEVLSVSRRSTGKSHPKLKEYIVNDFLSMKEGDRRLAGYDACFFCAGVSSLRMSEADYTRMTYETTLHFAKIVSGQNPEMTFVYVSGAGTDSTERGRSMWARVKGRTENALTGLPFRKVHNFRPAFIKPLPGQKHVLSAYKYVGWLYPILRPVFPNVACTASEIAAAMIQCATGDVDKTTIEMSDIRRLASAH